MPQSECIYLLEECIRILRSQYSCSLNDSSFIRCTINDLYNVRARRNLEIGWSKSLSLGMSIIEILKDKATFQTQRWPEERGCFSQCRPASLVPKAHSLAVNTGRKGLGDEHIWRSQNCHWGVFHKDNVGCALSQEQRQREEEERQKAEDTTPALGNRKGHYRTVASRESPSINQHMDSRWIKTH